MTLTHFKNKNQTIEMVDISKKKKTERIAVAESLIKIDKSLYQVLLNDQNLFSNLSSLSIFELFQLSKNYDLFSSILPTNSSKSFASLKFL